VRYRQELALLPFEPPKTWCTNEEAANSAVLRLLPRLKGLSHPITPFFEVTGELSHWGEANPNGSLADPA
jgi:hypothetical protein